MELGSLLDKEPWQLNRQHGSSSNAPPARGISATGIPPAFSTPVIPGVGTSDMAEEFPDEDDVAQISLANRISLLSIDPVHRRFFGKSSGAMLIQTAMELKKEYIGTDDTARIPFIGTQRPEFWKVNPVSQFFRRSLVSCSFPY
jgi:hypothetical protein